MAKTSSRRSYPGMMKGSLWRKRVKQRRIRKIKTSSTYTSISPKEKI